MGDVDDRATDLREEVLREHLHVASEHHQVDVALEQVQVLTLDLGLGVGRDRGVHERDAEVAHVVTEVGVVADDHRDRHVDLATSLPTDEVEHVVIGLGDQDRDPLGLGRFDQAPTQPELATQAGIERGAQVVPPNVEVR